MNDLNRSTLSDDLTLVLGGTGKTGRRVAQRLAHRGVPTRIASRTADPAFDWGEPGTWDAVLDGVTAAYVSYSPDLAIPGATDAIRAFVGKAVAHGVRRLVLLSGRGEEEAQRCEGIVRDAGVEWTVVRAPIPHQAFAAGITESGAPQDIAWLLDYLFSTVLDGRNAHVCDGVRQALGREPTDFVEYARRVAASGAWDVPSARQAAVA